METFLCPVWSDILCTFDLLVFHVDSNKFWLIDMWQIRDLTRSALLLEGDRNSISYRLVSGSVGKSEGRPLSKLGLFSSSNNSLLCREQCQEYIYLQYNLLMWEIDKRERFLLCSRFHIIFIIFNKPIQSDDDVTHFREDRAGHTLHWVVLVNLSISKFQSGPPFLCLTPEYLAKCRHHYYERNMPFTPKVNSFPIKEHNTIHQGKVCHSFESWFNVGFFFLKAQKNTVGPDFRIYADCTLC